MVVTYKSTPNFLLRRLLRSNPMFFFVGLYCSTYSYFEKGLFRPRYLGSFRTSPLIRTMFITSGNATRTYYVSGTFFLRVFRCINKDFQKDSPLLRFNFGFKQATLYYRAVSFYFISRFIFNVFFRNLATFAVQSLPRESLHGSAR